MPSALRSVIVLASLFAVHALVLGSTSLPRLTRPAALTADAAHRFGTSNMQVEAPVKTPAPPTVQLTPPDPKGNTGSEGGKKYKVLLFNDNMNKREYVAKVLTASVPGMTPSKAYTIMQKAHQDGMAVVGVWVFELAEAYCQELKSGGLISSVTEEE